MEEEIKSTVNNNPGDYPRIINYLCQVVLQN